MILYLKECCEVWEKIWTNKVWALSLNSCVWSNGKWDLVDLSGDSFLQWQTWDKHFNIPNIYSDTSQHLLDSDFKSTSNFLIVHHFPLRINHWSPFQISSPSSVFFQSFSHWFLLRSALFVLAEVIDPPSDGIERVDDVRGWMSDSRSLALVSPIERILLAEFLLFPGVLQSVANPWNYSQQSADWSHLIRITRSLIRRPSWVPKLTSFFPTSLLSIFFSFCFRQCRKPYMKYLEIVSIFLSRTQPFLIKERNSCLFWAVNLSSVSFSLAFCLSLLAARSSDLFQASPTPECFPLKLW